MRDIKLSKTLITDSKLYLLIIGAMVAVMFYYNTYVAVTGLVILAYLIYYNWRNLHLRKVEWENYISNLLTNMDSATKYGLFNIPLPMVMVELNGTVSWYNPRFATITGEESMLDKNIGTIIPNYNPTNFIHNKEDMEIEVTIKDRHYQVLCNIVKIQGSNSQRHIIMMYWIDNTDYIKTLKSYKDEKTVVALVQVDNFQDVLETTPEHDRPIVMAEVDKRINGWGQDINGSIKKFESDKYIVFFENKFLQRLEEKKFGILDIIRELRVGNKIPLTLSIGVGIGGKNPVDTTNYARAAIDLALGRGGDQAVVKNMDKFMFYGGKAKAVEKRTKVRARVIAYALKQLIDQSSSVIVMTHKVPDLDCLGAALGVYRMAKSRDKEAKIILTKPNPSIASLLKRLEKEEEYKDIFVNCNDALAIANKETLVVAVDGHRPSYMECEEILKYTDKIVVIDHHRRGVEFIENAVLTYLETYASSTCELVTEILQYVDENIALTQLEAEGLLAGIFVDTKNFSFKTGSRTFEAAAYLRKMGADTVSTRQLFQYDIETFVSRAEIVKNAEIINNSVAIAHCPPGIKNSILITAQAADELLNIDTINASFVLCVHEESVYISGRSLGDVNVQLILEKLGGGGHFTVAGAQLSSTTMEEATRMVKEAIEEYFKEGEVK